MGAGLFTLIPGALSDSQLISNILGCVMGAAGIFFVESSV